MALPELVFWDVDTQVDFIHPSGRLYVPGAEKIVPHLRRLTEFAQQHKIPVIASADAHRPDDPEFQTYPPHCLAGTPGQHKIPETLLENRAVVPNRSAELPNLKAYEQVIVEKQHVNVFTNPNVENLLKLLPVQAEFVVYGVVTEICVSHAVLGLLQRGRKVRLVQDAVQHLDQSKANALLTEVEGRGGLIVTTGEVVSASQTRGRDV